MHRVVLALLLLFSLLPAPAVAGPAVGEAARWTAVVENAQHAVLGAEAAELHAWASEKLPEGSSPPAALPPPSAALARAHAPILPSSPAPVAPLPCGPQSLPYHATAPPLLS